MLQIPDQTNSFARILRWRLVTFLLIVPLAACNLFSSNNSKPGKDKGPSEITVASPATAATEPASQVSRRNSNVSLTTSNEPEGRALSDNDWHDLHNGDRIDTDTDGEAELNITNCMRVYVFKTSQLLRSACPKSAYQSGSVTCAAAGTSLFNNSCGSKVVIQTGGVDISLEGTYLSVTYLPNEQLTLVVVLRGKVRVQPVVNFAERTLGEAVEVSEGNFILSVPEDKQAALRNMDIGASPGKALPLDQLRGLVGPLKLEPWLDSITQQAKSDGISPPAVVSNAMSSNQTSIDCDCASVSAGLLTGPYQRQCKEAENGLKAEYARTGKVTGKCDMVASGPNARPR